MQPKFAYRIRAGFTLVELLVVMSLMVLLASLAVLVIPTGDSRACTRTADQVQGWIAAARNRAVRDQTPRGVRLVLGNTANPTLVTEIQYLEQPDPYIPRSVAGVASTVKIFQPPAGTPGVPGGCYIARIGDVSPAAAAGVPLPPVDRNAFRAIPPTTQPFAPGDLFEYNAGTTYRFLVADANGGTNAALTGARKWVHVQGIKDPTNNNVYDVFLVAGNAATNSFNPSILGYTNTLNKPADTIAAVQLNAGECRIIRQPKPVIGEQPLLLPQSVCIDPALTAGYLPALSGAAPDFYYDIIFGGRGELLGQNTTQVILWVRSVEDSRWTYNTSTSAYTYTAAKKSGFGSPTLISISARSGNVAAHPVAATTTPLSFTTDGMSDSGM